MAPCSLTQSQLKELLHYDPDTGIFINKVTRNSGALIGDQAGTNHSQGYRMIVINRKSYLAHRLAWLYTYGSWPKYQLDHINQIKNDNRISNLREVNNSQNSQNTGLSPNNSSGHKGISWHKQSCKWHAYIMLNYKLIHLGFFINLDAAIAARKQAEEQLHSHRAVA